MGWNGSDRQSGMAESKTPLPSGKRSYRGLAAGAIVVVVGCAAVWWLVGGSGASSPTKADRRTSQIASRESQQKASAVQPTKRKVVRTGDKVADALEEVKAEAELVKIEPQKDLPRQAKKTDRIFKTGVEQLMGFIMAVEPGEMPLPIGKISEDDRKNLVSILISKNEIADADSEGIANLKENVDYCKKEMAKFIADGGEPNDFLQYYFQQLNTAFQTRNEVQSQYDDLREEDPELAKQFLSKANDLLDQKGIKRVADEDDI